MRDDQGSMDHAQGIEEKELTDFERYLLDRLLNSGEDCCGKLCVFDKKTELCEAILPGGGIDDAVCYRGIRKHYEAQGERSGGGNVFFIEKNMHKVIKEAEQEKAKEILSGLVYWLKGAIRDSYNFAVKELVGGFYGGKNHAFHEMLDLVKKIAEKEGVEVDE